MSRSTYRLIFIFSCILLPIHIAGQEYATLFGKISDPDQRPIFPASIAIPGTRYGTVSKDDGSYSFQVPAAQAITVEYSCLGYISDVDTLILQPGDIVEINKVLEVEIQNLDEVYIREELDRSTTITRIDIKTLRVLPSATGSIESLIKTLPGVASANELSSQYSVRGGNFDENLVYVNDIEIHRPFLIRSGQQEGLSFINSDMVSSVKFSAGGFEAIYGDKMSSVLDITYRRPTHFGATVRMSLLGASLHLEGTTRNNRLTHNTGFRYKTNRYLLSSLETKGEYIPNFIDFQSLISYHLTGKMEISFLGNIADNKYRFIPEKRSTDFGTFRNPLNLIIYYDGQESDKFDTYLGAITAHYRPSNDISLKIIASAFTSIEEEKFDIQGQYLINELDNTFNSRTYGDSIMNIGIGTFLNHARNNLMAYVYSISHLGTIFRPDNQLKWGIQYKTENIHDRLSEWELIDSAGYSVPYSDTEVLLSNVAKSRNHLFNNRLSGFIQNTYTFELDSVMVFFNAGVRANYWDYNQQLLISPRLTLSIKPYWKRDMMFRLSTGLFHQPPFYRELRFPDGSINANIRAQKSIHFVLGGDYLFTAWDRPFKLTTELYYKHMYDLIPYKLDNVRIQYAAENIANGYALGFDIKINGEFVKDAESWASLSIMKTEENIEGDDYYDNEGNLIEPGYYPRPTDQRINFGLFFQDYLPNNPDYKVHLTFLYGGKLPFSPPYHPRYDLIFRMPAYKRVDIGFSKVLKRSDRDLPEGNPFRHFDDIWLSAEIFNLLGVNNTISYLWVKTVANQEGLPGQFAVPNYLTSRRFNIKLTARF